MTVLIILYEDNTESRQLSLLFIVLSTLQTIFECNVVKPIEIHRQLTERHDESRLDVQNVKGCIKKIVENMK